MGEETYMKEDNHIHAEQGHLMLQSTHRQALAASSVDTLMSTYNLMTLEEYEANVNNKKDAA
eukprot:12921548-Prorocentrum_lima.AAC.1